MIFYSFSRQVIALHFLQTIFFKESSFTSLCTKLGTLYFLQPDFCPPDQTETRKLLDILPSMSGNAQWSLQTLPHVNYHARLPPPPLLQ